MSGKHTHKVAAVPRKSGQSAGLQAGVVVRARLGRNFATINGDPHWVVLLGWQVVAASKRKLEHYGSIPI